MENVIIIIALAAILGAAILCIRKARKHGVKCIGCHGEDRCGK